MHILPFALLILLIHRGVILWKTLPYTTLSSPIASPSLPILTHSIPLLSNRLPIKAGYAFSFVDPDPAAQKGMFPGKLVPNRRPPRPSPPKPNSTLCVQCKWNDNGIDGASQLNPRAFADVVESEIVCDGVSGSVCDGVNGSVCDGGKMSVCDEEYWRNLNMSDLLSTPSLAYALNDKHIFTQLTTYNTSNDVSSPCVSPASTRPRTLSPLDISSFFTLHKSDLFVRCEADTPYTYCQHYFLFHFNSTDHVCRRFKRQSCFALSSPSPTDLPDRGFSGVTLSTQFSFAPRPTLTSSLNRFNRFAYTLRRWRGPVSVSVFALESEVERVASKLIQFGKRGDIVFSVYVRKSVSGANEPFYILPFTKGRMRLRKGMYPMNLLRDLSIESIRTSHYFMMDIDVFPSNTLYSRVIGYGGLLSNPGVILVLPLFSFRSEDVLNCTETDRCSVE